MVSPESAPRIGRSRWYVPTPGKFVSLLLLSVVALYLSDQYDWFAFNKPKGWTVLIAVAVFASGLGLIVIWSVVAWLFGRRVQFGLLLLLLMVPTVAVPFAWLTREMQKAKNLADTITQLQRAGGQVSFNAWPAMNRGKSTRSIEAFGATPLWLRQAFGDEFFGEVGGVVLKDGNRLSDVTCFREVQAIFAMPGVSISDGDLDAIVDLPHLEEINFFDTKISDEGLKKLSKIGSLKNVFIVRSKATTQGRVDFEKAFAGRCHIGVNHRLGLGRFREEKEADSPPKYDSPRTLEFRGAPISRALQEERDQFEHDRKKMRRNIDELPKSLQPPLVEPLIVPDGIAPDGFAPERPERSTLEDFLEIRP